MNSPGTTRNTGKVWQVLLVEDNPGDVRLTREAFKEAEVSVDLHVTMDGAQAMAFLLRQSGHEAAPRPDLILLDLNLPIMDGREVLARIKADDALKTIPIVVLTTSEADSDVLTSYQLRANAFVTKPIPLTEFEEIVSSISDFWLSKVKLPPPHRRPE